MPYSVTDLQRFLDAHNQMYLTACSEINKGKKETHWMWFVFPQIKGLGKSTTSQFYALHDLNEAAAFLNHPVLGKHLITVSEMLLAHQLKDASLILGDLDTKKLQSCMTLFALVEGAPAIFNQILIQFFKGVQDPFTISKCL